MTEHVSLMLAVAGIILAGCLTAINMSLSEVSGGMLRKLEETDEKLARQFVTWIERRDQYRITIRILLIADAAFVIACAAQWLGNATVSGSTLIASAVGGAIIYFLLTEWLGRDVAQVASRYLLKVTMPTVRVLGLLMYPLAYPMAQWHRFVKERHEIATPEEEQPSLEDEILSLVEQADKERQGAPLEDDERRMIKGIFDLDETLVREIMTPRVDIHALPDSAGVDDVRQTIVVTGHSRLPVYHDSIDHVLGMLRAKDLLDNARIDDNTTAAALTHPAIFIPETKNVGDLLHEFQQNTMHFAVVVDEYGGTAGIVTLEDILEEIVGEIHDEYDRERRGFMPQPLPDGSFMADARISIHDINETLELDIPEDEDYDTLGGYISSRLGHIPKPGERLDAGLASVDIVEADRRRVLKVKLQLDRHPAQPDTPDKPSEKES